jgi:hypothetical protein
MRACVVWIWWLSGDRNRHQGDSNDVHMRWRVWGLNIRNNMTNLTAGLDMDLESGLA